MLGGAAVKILAFGEIILDIFDGNASLGGAPLNFCAHAVRAGGESALISAVGQDAYGELALGKMRTYGVETAYVGVLDDYPTGTCQVTLNEAGEPTYTLAEDTAYDNIPMPEELPEEFDALYFGTLALRKPANRKVLKKLLRQCQDKEVLVDVNIRPPFYSKETILFALKNATILKISQEELPEVMRTLYGGAYILNTALYALTRNFPNIKLLLLTRGAEGSIAYDQFDGKMYYCDAVETDVVSTVGAGDSFSATFLVNYLQGKTCLQSLQAASEVSAFVISREGAIPEE